MFMLQGLWKGLYKIRYKHVKYDIIEEKQQKSIRFWTLIGYVNGNKFKARKY